MHGDVAGSNNAGREWRVPSVTGPSRSARGPAEQPLDLAARMRHFEKCGSPGFGSGFSGPWKKAARMPLSIRPRTAASV